MTESNTSGGRVPSEAMAVDGEVEACKGGKVKKRKGKTLNTTTPQSLSRKLSDGSSAVACDTAVTSRVTVI
jgi:hypothetical protein